MPICASCGFENPQVANFCMSCGLPLTSLGDNQIKKRLVVQKLREYGKAWKEPETAANGSSDKSADDEADPYKEPLKFLLGVIFDQMIDYEMAWKAPYELERRLGHLDIHRISSMGQKELASIIAKGPFIHWQSNQMATWVIAASKRLLSQYDGKPEKIWNDKPSARTLETRFREFEGIGQKKGSMAVNILVRDHGVAILGTQEDIDVSDDTHVRRVFVRSGLAVQSTEADVVGAARRLNPSYPGELDHPAWAIGRYWCHPTGPKCSECPLDAICPKIL